MKKIENLNPETLKRFLDGVVDGINGINIVIAPLTERAEAARARLEAKAIAKAVRAEIEEVEARKIADAKALLAEFEAEQKTAKEAKAKAKAAAEAKAKAIAEAKKLVN